MAFVDLFDALYVGLRDVCCVSSVLYILRLLDVVGHSAAWSVSQTKTAFACKNSHVTFNCRRNDISYHPAHPAHPCTGTDSAAARTFLGARSFRISISKGHSSSAMPAEVRSEEDSMFGST